MRHDRNSRHAVLRTLTLALTCGVVSSAQGLTIDLVYRGPGSSSPDPRATAPSFDPNGTLLMAQMQQAAIDWSAVIKDTHTMTVDVFYANDTYVPTKTANARTTNAIAFGGGSNLPNRTTQGEIKFFAGQVSDLYDWWFDPTPSNDSEFVMGQILLGDLTPAEQAYGFALGPAGAPLLEIGYRGVPNASSPASGKFDVLGTARHELGHLLGVTNYANLLAAGEETEDDDYDFSPAWVGGASVASRVQTNIEPEELDSHLEALQPVMSGYGSAVGTRRDISAVDVFSSASVANWTQMDLKRTDYMRFDLNFHNPANWEGNRVPNPSAFVAIRHGGNVLMAANDVVGSFLLGDASTLATGPNALTVQGLATIGPTSGVGTALLTVGSGGGFFARQLEIDDATVAVAGGQLAVAQGDITNGGRIEGAGAVRFDGFLRNNGVIEADGGTLVIEEAIPGSGARVDLDGQFSGSPGTVRAVTGSLLVNAALDGASGGSPALYSGEIIVGAGRFFEVSSDLRLQSGSLTLDGSATQTATFRGPKLIVNADLIADRRAAVDAPVEINAGGDLQVPQANDTLTFPHEVTLLGGDITGAGVIDFQGGLNAGFGDIDVGRISLGDTATVVQASVAAEEIDASGESFFLNGGSLAFDLFTGKLGQSGGVIRTSKSKLDGSLIQQGGGAIAFDINGPGDNSYLDVTQGADLDGVIEVTLTGGYDPAGGEQFQVLTADTLNIESLALGGPDADRFQLLVGSGSIVLEALAVLVGDYNGDGLVDAADYTVWRDGDLAADGDGDGMVDADDYDLWANNYGASSPAASTAVPEPSALLLACLCLPRARRR